MENELFEINYKKSLGKNYMCLKPCFPLGDNDIAADTDSPVLSFRKDFRIKMIVENHIKGILHTHIQYTDSIPVFHYDITGLQSLNVLLENVSLNYSTLCLLFSGIYTALLSCENYMLKQDHLLLSPEHIFISSDLGKVCLCYFPIDNTDFTTSICSLFDYLLKMVDHKDQQCVYLAYSMHRECHSNDFTLNKLYTYLSSVPIKSTDIVEDEPPIPSGDNLESVTDDYPLSINDMPLDNLRKKSFIHKMVSSVKNKFSSTFTETPPIADYQPEPGIAEDFHYGNSSTVLLSSPDNSDSHMLIYTGTDMSSKIKITHYPFVIGKNESCDHILSNPMISRLHSRLSCQPGDDGSLEYYIEDLNSTNGTFLNDIPLTPYEKYPLSSGDHISFGHLTYIFR